MTQLDRFIATAKPSRPASKPDIREALRTIYAGAAENPPNVNRAWDLLKTKLPSARRSRVREVLAEPEFACRRREPGKKQVTAARQTVAASQNSSNELASFTLSQEPGTDIPQLIKDCADA